MPFAAAIMRRFGVDSHDFSSSKPSDDVPPMLSQEASTAPEIISTNSLLIEQGVKIQDVRPDERLPEDSSPQSEAASVADSSSEKRYTI